MSRLKRPPVGVTPPHQVKCAFVLVAAHWDEFLPHPPLPSSSSSASVEEWSRLRIAAVLYYVSIRISKRHFSMPVERAPYHGTSTRPLHRASKAAWSSQQIQCHPSG
ncbi:hypothetical protein TNCV_3783291 [Trichonephila clavipes]|nr:hypothetical protein TNCV_3783291 [Trichonephila clavipes]